MPTYSFGWHVNLYQPSNQKKKQGQEKSQCQWFLCFSHQLAKIRKKGAEKQRRCLVVHANATNKEEPMLTVQSIISLVEPNAKKKKRKGKGKADNANLFVWLACQSISAKQPKKEARPREIMTPTVPLFQPQTRQNWEKREQKSRGDASSFTPMQPTKKSQC